MIAKEVENIMMKTIWGKVAYIVNSILSCIMSAFAYIWINKYIFLSYIMLYSIFDLNGFHTNLCIIFSIINVFLTFSPINLILVIFTFIVSLIHYGIFNWFSIVFTIYAISVITKLTIYYRRIKEENKLRRQIYGGK